MHLLSQLGEALRDFMKMDFYIENHNNLSSYLRFGRNSDNFYRLKRDGCQIRSVK